MNRRGQLDTAIIPIFVLLASVGMVLVSVLALLSQDVLTQAVAGGLPSTGASTAIDMLAQLPTITNFLFIIGMIMLALLFWGLAFFTPTHPAFGFLVLPIFLLGPYFGYEVAHAWQGFDAAATGVLASGLDAQPAVGFLMANLHFFFLGVSFIAAILFYAGLKNSAGPSGGAFG